MKTKLPDCLSQYENMADVISDVKKTLGITNDEELANRVGMHADSIKSWVHGRHVPSSTSAKKLASILAQKDWGTPKCQRDAFVAYNTICYDSVKRVYDQIAKIGDPIALSCAVHSILVKIACIIENYNTTVINKGIPVQKMHSVYGASDYGEIMNCTYLTAEGKYSDNESKVFIKIAIINSDPCFVYQLENIKKNNTVYKTSGIISDVTIDKIANHIIKHLTKSNNK